MDSSRTTDKVTEHTDTHTLLGTEILIIISFIKRQYVEGLQWRWWTVAIVWTNLE